MVHQITPSFNAAVWGSSRGSGIAAKKFQPQRHEQRAIKRDPSLQPGSFFAHRLYGSQVSNQGFEVLFSYPGVCLVRHDRQNPLAVWPDASSHGFENFLVGPTSNSSFLIGAYIRSIHGSKGDREGSSTRVRCPFRDRMTRAASGDGEDILASFNKLFPTLLGEDCSRSKRCEHEQNRQRTEQP